MCLGFLSIFISFDLVLQIKFDQGQLRSLQILFQFQLGSLKAAATSGTGTARRSKARPRTRCPAVSSRSSTSLTTTHFRSRWNAGATTTTTATTATTTTTTTTATTTTTTRSRQTSESSGERAAPSKTMLVTFSLAKNNQAVVAAQVAEQWTFVRRVESSDPSFYYSSLSS